MSEQTTPQTIETGQAWLDAAMRVLGSQEPTEFEGERLPIGTAKETTDTDVEGDWTEIDEANEAKAEQMREQAAMQALGDESDEETDQPADLDELAPEETTGEGTGREPEQATKKTRTRPGNLGPCECSKFSAQAEGFDLVTTGCAQQTNRTFAQGHDAKLVSFLVKSAVAGKVLRYGSEGQVRDLDSPAQAAAIISPDLANKAQRMMDKAAEKAEARNLREAGRAQKAQQRAEDKAARDLARAQRAAEKAERAAAFKERQSRVAAKVTVEEGTTTADPKQGDVPPSEIDPRDPAHREQWVRMSKQVRVGRWTYTGMPQDDGSLRYLNTAGEMKTAEAGKWRAA